MRGIDQAQKRPARAELNLILIEQLDGFGDPLAVYQRPVEALQVAYYELFAAFPDLSMTA